MPAAVERITVSRDLPFAQRRVAKAGKFSAMRFLSDYRDGSFGRSVGLLREDTQLLARAVILVDKRGIVRYLQVVPEISHLPDMERAFAEAARLAAE